MWEKTAFMFYVFMFFSHKHSSLITIKGRFHYCPVTEQNTLKVAYALHKPSFVNVHLNVYILLNLSLICGINGIHKKKGANIIC